MSELTMREIIARAIEDAFVEESGGFGEEDDRKIALLCTEAVLDAMREPTPDMIHVGGLTGDETATGAAHIWQAMIDAAARSA